ncbi:hypothetical protein [Crenothrix sp.]|uniref:hypothetical protein n=1 Tax=Crenothrix sp. TaxID=3100433 RepID=UPI00374DB36D
MLVGAAILSAAEWAKVKSHQEMIIIAVLLIICMFIIRMIWRFYQHKKWISYLKNKYDNDMLVVDAIVDRQFWTGQTSEQLIDSIGRPIVIDRKILKTRTKEIWKYYKIRKDQYALKITLEDGYVVGWDDKG